MYEDFSRPGDASFDTGRVIETILAIVAKSPRDGGTVGIQERGPDDGSRVYVNMIT
jgi:hypothetical protein